MSKKDGEKKRSRRARVRPGFVIAGLFAGLAIGLTYAGGGLVAAIVLTVAIVAAVLEVWNPLKPGPSPHLELAFRGEDSSRVVIGGYRPLDMEPLVEQFVGRAKSLEPPDTDQHWMQEMMRGGRYRRPTPEEREEFAQKVKDYEIEVRAWLEGIERLLRDEALVLDADLVMLNPAREDALRARSAVQFPPDFSNAEDSPQLPRGPELPSFPHKLSPTAMSGRAFGSPVGPSTVRSVFAEVWTSRRPRSRSGSPSM